MLTVAVDSLLSTVPSLTLNVKLSLVAVSDVAVYTTLEPSELFGKSLLVTSVPPSVIVPFEGREVRI